MAKAKLSGPFLGKLLEPNQVLLVDNSEPEWEHEIRLAFVLGSVGKTFLGPFRDRNGTLDLRNPIGQPYRKPYPTTYPEPYPKLHWEPCSEHNRNPMRNPIQNPIRCYWGLVGNMFGYIGNLIIRNCRRNGDSQKIIEVANTAVL